jgi:hypothetical protein
MTKRDAAQEEAGRLITWSLRGRTYVPVTASRGLGRLDEDRANSMTDEGGPPHLDRVPDNKPR